MDELQEQTDEQTDDYDAFFQLDSAKVQHGGRVTIDSDHRDRYDVEGGDVVDVMVHTDDGRSFLAFDIPVQKERGRFRIPQEKRETHDVQEGDWVDVDVGLKKDA